MKTNPSLPEQAGVALIVALTLLIVMTLLGLAGVRSVALQEKMTGNTYDRSLAFQSAEAALRTGETLALTQANAGRAAFFDRGAYVDADNACGNSRCQDGLCNIPDKDCPPRWEDTAFTGWADDDSKPTNPLLEDVSLQYFVEFLGSNHPCRPESALDPCVQGDPNACVCSRYRITARSRDAAGNRAEVMLQSIYLTP
jgi:type IV pilus assembly protein PilX